MIYAIIKKRWRALPLPVRSYLRSVALKANRMLSKKAPKANIPWRVHRKELLHTAKQQLHGWQLDAARTTVQKILDRQPDHVAALHLSADIHLRMGDRAAAEAISEVLLRVDPLDLRATRRLVLIKGSGQVPFDADHAERFVAANQDDPDAYIKAANYLNEGGLSQKAIEIAQTGLSGAFDRDETTKARTKNSLYYAMGIAHEALDHYEAAAQAFSRIDPETSQFRAAASPYARCLLELGMPDEAEHIMRGAGIIKPDAVQFNPTLVSVYYEQQRIRDAHALYRHRPQSIGIADFFQMPTAPSEINIRSGAYADKSAMIFAEFGPGDEIRFSSMYSEIFPYFADLTITCDPRLHSLMVRSFPKVEFIPTLRHRREVHQGEIDDRASLTEPRIHPFVSDHSIQVAQGKQFACSVMDMLGEFRAERSDFSRQPARLVPDASLVHRWAQRLGTKRKLRVGLAWRSLLESNARKRHYLSAADLAPLGDLESVEFWLLQPNASPEEIATLREFLTLHVPESLDLKDDFEGQAALIANLDAVVSPLTTTAELAGMVGAKTFILCRTRMVTWRQNSDGSDIWYEHAELLTGTPPHDVFSLVQALQSRLASNDVVPLERDPVDPRLNAVVGIG